MSFKRTATIVVVGGALAAWLANAATSNREIAPAPAPLARQAPVEVRGAELAAEIARLQERLRPAATPQSPGRNLFAFRSAAARPVPVAPAPPPPLFFPTPAAVTTSPSGFKLSGLAEDAGADGAAVRTAIITSPTQLFLVKEGDAVTARYRVAKISADAVELTDVNGGAALRLVLK